MMTRILLLVLLGSLGGQGVPIIGMQSHSQEIITADMHMLRANLISYPTSTTVSPPSVPTTAVPHPAAPTTDIYSFPKIAAPIASAPYAAPPLLDINPISLSIPASYQPFSYADPIPSLLYGSPPYSEPSVNDFSDVFIDDKTRRYLCSVDPFRPCPTGIRFYHRN